MFNLRKWASNSEELMGFNSKRREQRDLQAEPAVPAPVIDKPDSVSDNTINDPENCKTVTQDNVQRFSELCENCKVSSHQILTLALTGWKLHLRNH